MEQGFWVCRSGRKKGTKRDVYCNFDGRFLGMHEMGSAFYGAKDL